jgi:hypothetical protein
MKQTNSNWVKDMVIALHNDKQENDPFHPSRRRRSPVQQMSLDGSTVQHKEETRTVEQSKASRNNKIVTKEGNLA